MGKGTAAVSTPSCAINISQVAYLLISSGDLISCSLHNISLRAFNSCDLLISSSLCGGDPFGLLGFKGEMGDPKKTNVVTPNTSGAEEEAAAIIADVGSH